MFLVGWSSSASADRVVLQSYAGAVPADADYLLTPVLAELGDPGVSTGVSTLGARIASELSRAGAVLTPSERRSVKVSVTLGFVDWRDGQFGAAIVRLSGAIKQLRSSSATVPRFPALRSSVFKAHVGLALAHARLGDKPAAHQAMAELIRSFPGQEISLSEFGPEPRALYRKAKAVLDKQVKASLHVSVNDASASVFINGRYAGLGETTQKLYPGRYRIYVDHPKTRRGRLHVVELSAGKSATLKVDQMLDQSLRTERFAGFVFADEEERQDSEVRLALVVGRALGVSEVVVVGIRAYQGRRSMVGRVLSVATGATVRAAQLSLEPPPPAKLIRALGTALAGGQVARGIHLLEGPGSKKSKSSLARGEGGDGGVWKWAALGTGALMVASGVTLLAIDGRGTCDHPGFECPSIYDTTAGGVMSLGLGAALVTTGVILWVRDRSRRRELGNLSVVPIQDGLAFSFGGEF